jgi:transposase
MQKHIKSCQLNQDLADICTIGLDVGDRYSYLCVLDAVDTVVNESRIRTTPVALAQYFSRLPRARVPLEAGTHSSWISRMLEDCGHFVILGNAREVRKIHQSTRKNDRTDAQIFGRLARVDATLLHPISLSTLREGLPRPRVLACPRALRSRFAREQW